MKCSKAQICSHSCELRLANEFSQHLAIGVANALTKCKVPENLAEKISIIVDLELDACDFCQHVQGHLTPPKDIPDYTKPRTRILDRAIVHMFELLYATLIRCSANTAKPINSSSVFFSIVSRGECLDELLNMIKKQCIGNANIKSYTQILKKILELYTTDEKIKWKSVYQSHKFRSYIYSLFTLISSHMKNGEFPIPALNNSMHPSHKPERINSLLKHMLTSWQEQQQAKMRVN